MNRFEEISAACLQRDATAAETLNEQTSQRLRALLAHHWKGANPAWRLLVESQGLDEAALPRSVHELSRLPLMTREHLRSGDFAERPNAAVFQTVSTSGSTQSSVRVPHNLEMSRATLFDNFLRLFALNQVAQLFPFYGLAHLFEGYVTGSQLTMTFMRDCFGEAAGMGVLTEPFELHCQRLRRLAAQTVASSPSVLTALANYVLQQGEQLPIPRLVVGGAPLHSGDRSILERAFRPRELLSFYPTTDAGALGCGEHETGDYQSFAETHLIEVIAADGTHVSEGEEGLIVVTALDSLAAPLIRYAVGDRVTYLGRSACGGRVRLRKIRRASEALIGDFKLPLADLDGWRDELAQRGFATSALQVAKRQDAQGRPFLIVRLESSERTAALEAAALDLIRADVRLGYGIQHALLCAPQVEMFAPGELLKGRFKLPVFVDEVEHP